MRHTRSLIALGALSLLLPACEEKTPPPPPKSSTPAPKAGVMPPPAAPAAAGTPAPAAAALGPAVSVLGLTFTVPSGWKQVPPANSMRLAEIQVPDASGDAGKACSVVFSTAGGDVQSNIDRWAGQVQDPAGHAATPKSESRTVAGMKVTVAEMTGSYANMGEATPHTNWVLRGGIVETPEGLLFIKMTGPAEQMASTAAAFNAMIDGLKKP